MIQRVFLCALNIERLNRRGKGLSNWTTFASFLFLTGQSIDFLVVERTAPGKSSTKSNSELLGRQDFKTPFSNLFSAAVHKLHINTCHALCSYW